MSEEAKVLIVYGWIVGVFSGWGIDWLITKIMKYLCKKNFIEDDIQMTDNELRNHLDELHKKIDTLRNDIYEEIKNIFVPIKR